MTPMFAIFADQSTLRQAIKSKSELHFRESFGGSLEVTCMSWSSSNIALAHVPSNNAIFDQCWQLIRICFKHRLSCSSYLHYCAKKTEQTRNRRNRYCQHRHCASERLFATFPRQVVTDRLPTRVVVKSTRLLPVPECPRCSFR